MEETIPKLNTKFLGKNLIILEEVPSTQNYIKKMREGDKKDGLVVLAKNQTAGIGTNGRKWYTKDHENLTFSFLLKPNCNIKKIENLSIKIAEVMIKVIKEKYGYDNLKIKYPNDIIVNSKKLGGILTEAIINHEQVKEIIVGIGLNVNQEEFTEEIKDIATSLKKEFNKEFNILKILSEFLEEFEREYMNIL